MSGRCPLLDRRRPDRAVEIPRRDAEISDQITSAFTGSGSRLLGDSDVKGQLRNSRPGRCRFRFGGFRHLQEENDEGHQGGGA